MHEFPCAGPIGAKIKMASGSAEIAAEERDTAAIEVEPYDDRDASREAASRTRVDLVGDTLIVEAPEGSGWLLRRSAKLRVTIRMPIGGTVNANVASADVTCRGTLAAATVNTASGDVSVEHVTGDLVVHTASGDVRAIRVDGDLRVDGASGDLHARYVGGHAKTASASGDVEIDQLAAGLQANTASGDVRIGAARHGTVKVNSASGDVSLGVVAGTGVWLDISTMSGTTSSDLDMPPDAGPAEPALTVQVRTMSGDVHIHRATAPTAPPPTAA